MIADQKSSSARFVDERSALFCGRDGHEDADAGYVMAMMGLLIVPLLIITAFAIDVGSWYAQGARMQRTADAASLAGVVWAGESIQWDTAARRVATRNGFTDGINGATVSVTRISESKINVSITRNGQQYFSKLVLPSEPLTRRATAEYIVPVPMGSPENALGNDPARGYSPNFWLNIAGINAEKVSGDRHTSGNCGSATFGCTAGSSATPDNTEYRPDGYFFKTAVTATSGNPLNIEVYDPAMVYQGDVCANNTPSTAAPVAPETQTQLAKLQSQYPSEPAARFQGGNTPFCAGDQALKPAADTSNNDRNIKTTYIVREPDNTPLDDTNNRAICAITFDAYNQNVFNLLDKTVAANLQPRGTENVMFSDHFHKYFTICNIPAAQVVTGDYIVQIRTNADLTSDPAPTTTANSSLVLGSLANVDATITPGGHNRYALRSGFGTLPAGTPTAAQLAAWSTGVSIFANGRLPMYVNTGGASTTSTTQFYLARITPVYAGKTLQLNFWDIGDVGNITNGATPPVILVPGEADFTIIPPADAQNPPTTCAFTRDGSTNLGSAVAAGCTITDMTSTDYNGKLTQARIPLPSNYTCTSTAADGCWFKISLTMRGTPTDTTTWSANVLGDPVHLVD